MSELALIILIRELFPTPYFDIPSVYVVLIIMTLMSLIFKWSIFGYVGVKHYNKYVKNKKRKIEKIKNSDKQKRATFR